MLCLDFLLSCQYHRLKSAIFSYDRQDRVGFVRAAKTSVKLLHSQTGSCSDHVPPPAPSEIQVLNDELDGTRL